MRNKSYLIICIILFVACKDQEVLVPKPRAYPKIEYPEKKYEQFSWLDCELTFQKPVYAKIVKDSSNQLKEDIHPCWFDIYFDKFNGSIHCSYIPITEDNNFEKLVKESFRVVDQVNKRSNYVEETVISKENMGGIYFTFEGPAASQAQFFLTDSTDHFFKASLYFYSKVRPDSIAPIAAFIKKDIEKMIETFNW